MEVSLTLDQADAEALLKRLYMPEKDREGRAVYVVDINLACKLRLALHKTLDK